MFPGDLYAGVKFPQGPLFRARRWAMGIPMGDVGLPPSLQTTMFRHEDGGTEPYIGWPECFRILNLRLDRYVAEWLGSGKSYSDLVLKLAPTWSYETIEAARDQVESQHREGR